MFKPSRILALDIGASKLALGEFSVKSGTAPELLNYGVSRLESEPDSEGDTSAFVVAALRDLMRENGIKPAPLMMTVSGQAVFPRYVKLPPVTRDKVFQIVSYEAEQNVPFPIDEVVWDYQLIEEEGGEQNVMLVAVKIENVKSVTDCVLAAGLEPETVDAAPMALYNAVLYNYSDLPGCTMVLDVGARSSNVILAEANRIFIRSMPVAGNAITQALAKEFEVSFKEAEALKLEHGFVSFGGVYAGPDNEVADRVSKIVRNVVTRLHAEVNRSINFYRGQQGGSQPSLVLLTGGSSVLPHLDTFFREKLKVEVEYLNPFANVPVNPRIDSDRIGADMNVLAEVVGLGLRSSLKCPVEINLMPPELVSKKVFRRRQPFFALAAVGLMCILLCWWVYFQRMRAVMREQVDSVKGRSGKLMTLVRQVDRAKKEVAAAMSRVNSIADVAHRRTEWIEVLTAIRSCLADGMWLMSVRPRVEGGSITAVEMSGRGFLDKLEDTDELSSIEAFRDRLTATPVFKEGTSITRLPLVNSSDFARDFTIVALLERPIERVGAWKDEGGASLSGRRR